MSNPLPATDDVDAMVLAVALELFNNWDRVSHPGDQFDSFDAYVSKYIETVNAIRQAIPQPQKGSGLD